jgi:hypothetical protein
MVEVRRSRRRRFDGAGSRQEQVDGSKWTRCGLCSGSHIGCVRRKPPAGALILGTRGSKEPGFWVAVASCFLRLGVDLRPRERLGDPLRCLAHLWPFCRGFGLRAFHRRHLASCKEMAGLAAAKMLVQVPTFALRSPQSWIEVRDQDRAERARLAGRHASEETLSGPGVGRPAGSLAEV